MPINPGDTIVLRGGRLGLGGPACDVTISDGRVASLGPVGSGDAPDGADMVTLDDATVLPGLVDSHVHVDQWVHHRHSVDLAGARGPEEAARTLRAHLDARHDPPGGLLLGRDLSTAMWDRAPDRRDLDTIVGDVAVAVRSMDLHSAWFSSAALALLGMPDHPTGLVREHDALEATARLDGLTPATVVDRWVSEALADLPALGLTGLVDLEFADNLTVWPRRDTPPVRVHAGVWTSWLDAALAAGRRTGDVLDGTGGRVHVGPYKVITDGSLNSRTAWCFEPYPDHGGTHTHGVCLVPAGDLEPLVRAAWRGGLVPAIHAIGDRANAAALDVFERVGCPGRIEHAQLVRAEDIRRYAELGVIASVQPQHATTDRALADRLWAGRTDRAFAYRSLHDAGVRIELGSDAPVSPLQPWDAVADAVHRTDDERAPWHPEQALPLEVALTAACGGRSSLAVGDVADITVVPGDPRASDAAELRATRALATLVGGEFTHRSAGLSA